MTPASERTAVLLDTCAVIWLADGEPLQGNATERLQRAGRGEGIFVSPISAWEVGLLSRPGARGAYQFLPDPATWFARFMGGRSIRLAALTADMGIAASHLPAPLHADPADRLLIATARYLGLPIITRDAKIIDYAAKGHVLVIPC